VQAGAAAAAASAADDDATSTGDKYGFPSDEDLMAVDRSLFGPCDSHRELDEQSKIMLRNSVDNTSQPFAAAVKNGEAVAETSNSSVVSPRIQARRRTNGSTSVQPVKTPEGERPPPNIFFPSLDTARCPELLPRQSQSTPKTKRSKLQHDSSSEDDDSDSLNSYQDDSFLAKSNESSSSGSFKTDDCEESESECFEESEEESGQFSDDYKEGDYDGSNEDDDDEEEPYVPPKRSSSKRKITPTKPFEYAKRKKVSTKKQKTIKDCAPYACTTEKGAITFLPTAAEATNSANNNHDSDDTGSSA
jgi:hypothetical protein